MQTHLRLSLKIHILRPCKPTFSFRKSIVYVTSSPSKIGHANLLSLFEYQYFTSHRTHEITFMLPSQEILSYPQEPKKAFRNWMLPMAWFKFFTNRHFYEIVFIKRFFHNFECWNRPKPLLSRPTPPPVTRLLLSHSSSRPTPPPAPFFLPSHAANRHSANRPMIDIKEINASAAHPDAHLSLWNRQMFDFKEINEHDN